MDLQNAKLGEKYHLYTQDNKVVTRSSNQTVTGTVIAAHDSVVLFGWKRNEKVPINADPRGKILVSSWKYIANQSDYLYCLAVGRYGTVHSKVGSSSSTDGMSCKKCNNFCQYADSNQDDGTFVCYGCRSYP